MRKLTFALVFVGGAIALGAGFVGLANAQSMPGPRVYGAGHVQIQPGIFGKVSTLSGTTISLTSIRGTSTIYTVNAASATVMKNGTSSSISNISVGDFVLAQGTISGDSVTATKIVDGFAPGMGRGPGGMMMGGKPGMRYGSSTRPFNASGTFPGYRNFSSSTASSTNGSHPARVGFFASIGNFFGGMLGHFKF